MSLSDESALRAVKLMHTGLWLFFVGCILGIWFEAARGRFGSATVLSGVVLVECAVLAVNRGHCPLTDVARRYSSDQSPNFDIYLPSRLARYNKWIFGILFVAGEVYLIAQSIQWIR